MKESTPFRLDTVNQCVWRGTDRQAEADVAGSSEALLLAAGSGCRGRSVTNVTVGVTPWFSSHVRANHATTRSLRITNVNRVTKRSDS